MTTEDTDAALLAEAFDVPREALRLISREPLGDGAVAGFEVTHSTETAGRATSIAYVDTSGMSVTAETGLVKEGVARIWTHPSDPHLPALVPTAFGDALGVLLARVGIRAAGPPEMIAYRPGRRAVLSAPTACGRIWVKVVMPKRIERILSAHRALEAARLPVPAVRGWAPDGAIIVDDAAGTAATHVEWDPHALLDEVDALRESLLSVAITRTARTRIPARLPWYSEQAARAMPEARRRLERLGDACRVGLADEPETPVPIHGDLHIGQLFLEGSGADLRISGVIDVDTAGLGDPAEDAAAFVSHAVASTRLTAPGPARDRIRILAAAARERWPGRRVGALTAIHLLGHAVGTAMRGDDGAETLLAHAEAAATGALIDI